MTDIELREALERISKHCKQRESCAKCELRTTDDFCYMQEVAASGWVFADTASIPRLFE